MSHTESGDPAADREHPRGGSSKPVTISYIAETAGVSVPTVSKVINGRSGVSADTRARVDGYRSAMDAANLPVHPDLMVRTDLTQEAGHTAARALLDPPLTTVHQPLTEMATAATELALALGRGEKPPQLRLELATTLTVRKSTAPPGIPQ
ncbi:LacI family DNA-binding transcriptional regulator [Saccharothrix deserti]|uniref:LacI family DNA-binding transcriptional regulator n=1 Tax=Saccharothrix deserti TaxID=2593674 RepID=UPI00131A7C72|nr:LacI family DNA-binding transcriptional regulator [Saccharothrix deserti]